MASARREACEALGWRYFRLNWNPKSWSSEPDATLRKPAITWAEGRSELYRAARDEATQYFIFIDDDIVFTLPGQDPARLTGSRTHPNTQLVALSRLARLLERYPVMTGTVFSPTDWGHRNLHAGEIKRIPEVFPIMCHDLQVQIFERSVAEKSFPLPIPGSGASAWHIQFLANALWPQNQLCLASVWAHNTASRPHADSLLPSFNDKEALLAKITPAINSASWDNWCRSDFQTDYGPHENAQLRTTAAATQRPMNWEPTWDALFHRSSIGGHFTQPSRQGMTAFCRSTLKRILRSFRP